MVRAAMLCPNAIDPAASFPNDATVNVCPAQNETVGNPRYPLDLFQRVITMSLETMKIVKGVARFRRNMECPHL